jgi:hypothetical protein
MTHLYLLIRTRARRARAVAVTSFPEPPRSRSSIYAYMHRSRTAAGLAMPGRRGAATGHRALPIVLEPTSVTGGRPVWKYRTELASWLGDRSMND